MTDFSKLDLTGVKPVSVPMETINVIINPEVMVDEYADAFVREIRRVSPGRYEQAPITQEEMRKYCRYILSQRVKCVYDECKDWRMLKNLWLPVFIQYTISLVGRVDLRKRGLTLMPIYELDEEMTLQEALELSNRINLYADDIQVRRDAMPRSKDGDVEVMSCALIAGYVKGLDGIERHPVASYVAAFLGFKIREQAHFEVMYRSQYDDLELIRSALTYDRTVMGLGD